MIRAHLRQIRASRPGACMALAQESRHQRIVRDPRIHGGEPIVRGTRVPVRAVVVAWRAEPDMRSILDAYPRLAKADARDALEYYEERHAALDERVNAQLADA